MGLAVLTFLSGDAQAVKFRPIEGTNPWHKPAKASKWVDPDWPVNYFVPNFGVDKEIATSQKHLAEAEKSLKTTMKASFKTPKSHPMNYFVPNFGQDTDIRIAQGNIKQTERDLRHKWNPKLGKDAPKPHPTDYFVPNFGMDKEIKASLANTQAAEKRLKTKWTVLDKKDRPAPHPTDYFVPNFGIDKDIKDSLAHTAAAEKKLNSKWRPVQDDNGAWIVPGPDVNKAYKANVQLEETVDADVKVETESDPICSSAGCNYASEKGTKTHPMNYFVPNFGQDHENVVTTDNSLAWAEKNLKHKWNPIL